MNINIGWRFTINGKTWRVTGLVIREMGGPVRAFTAVFEGDHEDTSWNTEGPPYADVEHVWDEEDIDGLLAEMEDDEE